MWSHTARQRIAPAPRPRASRSLVAIAVMAATVVAAGAGCFGDDDAPATADAALPDAYTGPDANTSCPAPLPAPAQCDYFLSCGCNTPAQKCSVFTGGKGCVGAGSKAAGQTCADDSECAPGTICASYGGALRCLTFCDPAHACSTGNACYIRVTQMQTEVGRVCGQICDLRAQDCTYDGQGCYPSDAILGQAEKGICVGAGAGAEGATCTLANDCAEGLTCLDSDGKCHKLCDLGGAEPKCTTSGQTCKAIKSHTLTGACQ